MTEDSVKTLGILLKRIGNYNKMESFDDRLILQKTVYLMQSFDLYVGYNFTWYIRGPYSPDLTKDGFGLRESWDATPEGRFKEEKDEENFKKFILFLGDKKYDAGWLEILASIHFLKKVRNNLNKEEIITIVKNKQSYFTKKMCLQAWKYLEEWGQI